MFYQLLNFQKQFNTTFQYTPDPLDYWRFYPQKGTIKGDCDDYSINFVNRLFKGFWKPILKKEAVLYHCTYYGEGHMIVKVGNYMIDNITKYPFTWTILPEGYDNLTAYSRWDVICNRFIFKSTWLFKIKEAYKKCFSK